MSTVRIRLTHLLAYPLQGSDGDERDGVGSGMATGAEGSETRFFIPGRLPCAACGLCRRGLAAACAAATTAIPAELAASDGGWLDLPDRFLTPLDDPADVDRLPSEIAAAAGLVALAIQAAAAANLTAGDVAIWLGGGALVAVGAQLTTGRGARTIVSPPRDEVAGEAGAQENTAQLLARLEAEPPPAGAAHQRSTRRLFLTGVDGATLQTAGEIADAGSSLVLLGRGPARLTGELVLPAEARLARVSGYHPDLIPEALALLRRGELVVPVGRAVGG